MIATKLEKKASSPLSSFAGDYLKYWCTGFSGEKTSWPELWGIEGEAAEAIIKRDNPNVDVISLPVGSITIHAFSTATGSGFFSTLMACRYHSQTG
ncbi:hypothetical protein FEM48_Zijuj07G0109700 [Ziziphus jujuba var. spinosa]|uniref:Uncharacterized protein n=1 Tax=Ziziphus jujuba var. spinosa TaxID=714518 RepID=A0A978V486_ZIZJJ|nr:hypothetical protein FEM48_Zijuj07G0109700 [Ziziphus jujuba var. spinosa]